MLKMWHTSGHFLEVWHLLHFYLLIPVGLIEWHFYNQLAHSLMHEDNTHAQILHGPYYPEQQVEVG